MHILTFVVAIAVDESAVKLREFAALLRSPAGKEEIAAFIQKEYAEV